MIPGDNRDSINPYASPQPIFPGKEMSEVRIALPENSRIPFSGNLDSTKVRQLYSPQFLWPYGVVFGFNMFYAVLWYFRDQQIDVRWLGLLLACTAFDLIRAVYRFYTHTDRAERELLLQNPQLYASITGWIDDVGIYVCDADRKLWTTWGVIPQSRHNDNIIELTFGSGLNGKLLLSSDQFESPSQWKFACDIIGDRIQHFNDQHAAAMSDVYVPPNLDEPPPTVENCVAVFRRTVRWNDLFWPEIYGCFWKHMRFLGWETLPSIVPVIVLLIFDPIHHIILFLWPLAHTLSWIVYGLVPDVKNILRLRNDFGRVSAYEYRISNSELWAAITGAFLRRSLSVMADIAITDKEIVLRRTKGSFSSKLQRQFLVAGTWEEVLALFRRISLK